MTIEQAMQLKRGEKVRDPRASDQKPVSDVTELIGIEPHVSPNVIAFPGSKAARDYYKQKNTGKSKSSEPVV